MVARTLPFAAGLLLVAGACAPQDVARSLSQRTAATVIFPVVNQSVPAPQAQAVTDCLTAAATQAQLEALMRDLGTRAGTDTVRNVQTIAASAAAQSCLASQGLPGLS